MPASRPLLCITCGLDAGPAPRMNRLEDGKACPSCRDRLLDSLPPLFPGFGHLVEAETPRQRSRAAVSGTTVDAVKKARRGRRRDAK